MTDGGDCAWPRETVVRGGNASQKNKLKFKNFCRMIDGDIKLREYFVSRGGSF